MSSSSDYGTDKSSSSSSQPTPCNDCPITISISITGSTYRDGDYTLTYMTPTSGLCPYHYLIYDRGVVIFLITVSLATDANFEFTGVAIHIQEKTYPPTLIGNWYVGPWYDFGGAFCEATIAVPAGGGGWGTFASATVFVSFSCYNC